MGTEAVLKGFDEWTRLWLEWWKPWVPTDVNHRRVVWTRWTGVPLHAWSKRFLTVASSRVGTMLNLHEVTKNRTRINGAYVRIDTRLASCDRILPCKIDGRCFNIRIMEVCCMDMVGLPV